MPSNCEGLHWLLQQLYIYERSFVCLQKELSLVHFDLITQEMLHLQYMGGFHAGPWPH